MSAPKPPATSTIEPPRIEPVVIDWFDDRYYQVTVNGVTHYLPSVTTKLGIIDKPFLSRWRGDLGNREADLRMHEAGDRGKRIHWAYEIALKGGLVIYNPWQNPVFTADGIQELRDKNHGLVAILQTQDEMLQLTKLQKQFDALKPEVLEIERKVYDIERRDAGTIDQVFRIKEGEYLISGAKPLYLAAGVYINDLKTGKSVDNNTWLQLAAYGAMYEALSGVHITGALITHTGATIKGGIQGLKTLVRDRLTLLGSDYPDYRHASALWERDHKDDQPETFQFPAMIRLLKGGTP
jgi:hypothetical protein